MSALAESLLVSDVLPTLIDSLNERGSGEMLRFAVAGRMQRRAKSEGVMRAVDSAKSQKAISNQPFWDALFDQMPNLSRLEVSEILALARFHQAMDDVATRFPFTLNGASFSRALNEHSDIPEPQILALSSRLRLESGEDWHIPMLDYRVPITPENDHLLVAQLGELGSTGWLFSSGRSYHFLGDTPLRGAEGLSRFLGSALLYSPIVDARWVAHQLVEGACALRVSSGDPSQIVPRLVTRIGT